MPQATNPQKIKVIEEEDVDTTSQKIIEKKSEPEAKKDTKPEKKAKTVKKPAKPKAVKKTVVKKAVVKKTKSAPVKAEPVSNTEEDAVIKKIKKTDDIIPQPKPKISTAGATMIADQNSKETNWIVNQEKPKSTATATATAPVNPTTSMTPIEKAEKKEKVMDILENPKSVVKELVKESKKEDEIKAHDEELVKESKSRRSIKLYRRIAYSFVGLTAVLIAVVSYFTLVKVEITLIPNQERLSNNLIFDIYDQAKNSPANESALPGLVQSISVTNENNNDSTGGEVLGEEVVGTVTLVNNYNKNQPLVATTRLLSADGKLFRLKNTVNIPAGGSLDTEVYADEPKEEMAIGPTKFTIPGLWAGLQEQIYAENSKPFVYQKKMKKKVAAADIETATAAIKDNLLEKAKTQVSQDYSSYKVVIYKLDENSIKTKIDVKEGDEVDTFKASASANVVVVAFDDSKAIEMAKEKFVSGLGQNKQLLTFEDSNIIYNINNFNIDSGQATVSANFEGKVTLKSDANIVEIDKILGLGNDQLNAYLGNISDLAGYEVKYYPSFLKTVPRLADRVKIVIKQ